MSDVKLGILLWSQAGTWHEMLDAARRVDRLGYAHLWTWDHVYAIFGDPYQPIFEGWSLLNAWARETEQTRLGPPRRRQHVPQPRHRRQDRRDARPRQRRPGDPGHRRGMDGAGAHGPRDRIRHRLRPAARLARRIGRRDAAGARWRVGHLRARRALRVQRPAPQPAAGPEAAADHDRRQRREEDAAHGRALRGHVERDGPDRRDEAQDRGPPGSLRRGRARHRRDRVHARRQGHDPRHRGRGRPRLEGRDGAQQDAARRRGGRRHVLERHARSSSPTGCARTSRSASGRSSPSSRRRTTSRRSSASSARSCRSAIEARIDPRSGGPAASSRGRAGDGLQDRARLVRVGRRGELRIAASSRRRW